MENRFNKLKKEIKLRFTLGIILFITILVVGFALCVIYKAYNYTVLVIIATFLALPLSFLIGRRKFEMNKIALIKDAVISLSKPFNTTYKYKKEVAIDDLAMLDVVNLAPYFYISSVIEAKYNDIMVNSYGIRFKATDKKMVLGRVIVFTFPEDSRVLKENITGSYLKNESYLKKIVVSNNKAYVFVSGYQRNKMSIQYNFEPHDFVSYSEYASRITNEFNFYKNVIKNVTNNEVV